MRLLITNDDGVRSPGLHALAIALHEAGHEVLVVAPSEERSGAAASIGYIASGVEFDIDAHPIPDAEHQADLAQLGIAFLHRDLLDVLAWGRAGAGEGAGVSRNK